MVVVQLNSCQDTKYKDMNLEEKAKTQEEILNRPSNIWPTNKDQNGDYYYSVNMGTMEGYVATDASSHFVTDKEIVSIPAMMLGQNWGEGTGSYVLIDEHHPLPKKLYVAWFSSSENKFYEGLFEMPYDKIKEEFDKMWTVYAPYAIQTVAAKYERFTDIIVGVAPKGNVVVWLSGGLQSIEIGRYKAKETTKITWKDFAEMNGMGEGATRENYLRNITESTSPLVGKLEQYEQIYTWKPKIESKNPVEVVLYEIQMYNGEKEQIYYEYKGSNSTEKRAVPKYIAFSGQSKPSFYYIEYTFKEDDIYKAFEALGKEDLPINLVLVLDKKNEPDIIILKNSKYEYVLDPKTTKFYPSDGKDYEPKMQSIKEN